MIDEEKLLELKKIKEIKDLSKHSIRDSLSIIIRLVNLSDYANDIEGEKVALKLAQDLDKRDLSNFERSILYYNIGNAYTKIHYLNKKDKIEVWDWEQPEVEKSIFYFRSSLLEHEKSEIKKEKIICEVYTNLANQFDHIGRFIESLEIWDKVLLINKNFGMSLGNKGLCLLYASSLLYDKGHRIFFVKEAFKYLNQSLNFELEPDARKHFSEEIETLLKKAPSHFFECKCNKNDFELKGSRSEIKYRKWCLNNCLFLNPLNDLYKEPIAARDILHTPNMLIDPKSNRGMFFEGFFNQIKMEYIEARTLFYEGLFLKPSFYFKETFLVDTLDYPVYSFEIEKLKLSFRIAYSLFDKIAYFLNEYLKLNIKENKVSLKNLWYEKEGRTKRLKDIFINYVNLPLRGLFWLSKDLYETGDEIKNVIEPEAQDLKNIRNYLEHKYLKICEDRYFDKIKHKEKQFLKDELCNKRSLIEFEMKNFKILKLARAAIIYLSCGIYEEENIREEKIGKNIKIQNYEIKYFFGEEK